MNQFKSTNKGCNIGGIGDTICEHLINNKLCINFFMNKLLWGRFLFMKRSKN